MDFSIEDGTSQAHTTRGVYNVYSNNSFQGKHAGACDQLQGTNAKMEINGHVWTGIDVLRELEGIEFITHS